MAFDAVFSALWFYGNTGDTSIEPNSTCWNWNESGLVVTEISLSHTDEDGIDRTDDLGSLAPDDRVHLRNTATADNWAMFTIDTVTDNTTWTLLGVTLLGTGLVTGLPKNRQRVLFDFARTAVETIGPLSVRYDDAIARVASSLNVAADDVWVINAVDSAIDFVITKTNRELVGLPDDPLTVSGVVVLAQRIYLDTPNGANVAIGDASFDPIFQPENLWKHVRHYFDRLDISYGVA